MGSNSRSFETTVVHHEQFDPSLRPSHCSNCLHCVVTGERNVRGMQLTRCNLGLGTTRLQLPYVSVIRPKHPMAFRTAEKCPGFEPMDDA